MDFLFLERGSFGGFLSVILRNDILRENVLGDVRVEGSRLDFRHHLPDFRKRDVGQKFKPVFDDGIRQVVNLVIHHVGRFAHADIVPEALAHLGLAVRSEKNRHEHPDLERHLFVHLEVAPAAHVELLVRSAEFHIALDCHGIVALHHRIHEFMQADGTVRRIAVVEIFTFEHLRHGKLSHELRDLRKRKLAEPFAVVMDFDAVFADDAEKLLLVFLCVFKNFFVRKARARLVPPGRVADLRRIVADDQDNGMP